MDNIRDLSMQSESFNEIISNIGLNFQFYDLLPIPIEIWDAEGTTIFINRAGMEMAGVKDASLLVGKYNLKNDPVCLEIMSKEVIDKIFRGETVTFPDFPAPIQDVLDRGVIEEKPWEAAMMDLFFLPLWAGDVFKATVCFFTIKNMYKGKLEIIKAKEYIDKNWLDEFDVEAVAKAAHVSVSHLYRLFEIYSDMAPGDYYKKVKVDHIKEKLADKELSIAQVFAACGEDGRGRIARIFKDITGLSPKEYRERL